MIDFVIKDPREQCHKRSDNKIKAYQLTSETFNMIIVTQGAGALSPRARGAGARLSRGEPRLGFVSFINHLYRRTKGESGTRHTLN